MHTRSAHRLGQTKQVTVLRLIAARTIEQRLLGWQRFKVVECEGESVVECIGLGVVHCVVSSQ